jgi:hypothetical protein
VGLAQSALTHPLYPQDTPWLYFGTWYSNAADHTHPPLGEYHLALLYKILGHFSETSFRILFAAPYAILAVLGFYGLAARWVSHPFWVSLLFAACPPFFVMAPTLMMDLPSMGCLLMGLRIFFSARNRNAPLVTSALLLTGALGMAYTVAIPIGALAMWCFHERRTVREKLATIVPFLVLGLWLISMTLHFGEFPLRSTMRYALSQFRPVHNVTAAISFLGGLAMFPWSIGVLRRQSRALLGVSIVCAALPVFWIAWPTQLGRVLYFVMASWGAILIFSILWLTAVKLREWRDWDSLFLSAWFFLSMIFFVFAADMMTARYLLLYLPPVYLLLLREVSVASLKRALGPTIALSLCIAIADYRMADGYRTWVDNNIPTVTAAGYRVWSATESGLRFYLARNGAQELASEDVRPRGTDLVIQHSNLFRYSLAPELATMLVEVKEFELQDWFPVRTFNPNAGAGFHDSRVGLIPFTFSVRPLDRIRMAQVSPFAVQLPIPARGDDDGVPVWTPNGVELRQRRSRATFEIPGLQNVQWKGELIGSGAVDLGNRSITLLRSGETTAVWRNFRIVPEGY